MKADVKFEIGKMTAGSMLLLTVLTNLFIPICTLCFQQDKLYVNGILVIGILGELASFGSDIERLILFVLFMLIFFILSMITLSIVLIRTESKGVTIFPGVIILICELVSFGMVIAALAMGDIRSSGLTVVFGAGIYLNFLFLLIASIAIIMAWTVPKNVLEGEGTMEEGTEERKEENGAIIERKENGEFKSRIPVSKRDSGKITGISGLYAGATIPIEPGYGVIIGRDASRCSLVYGKESPHVSRKHCEIYFEPGKNQYGIVDCSSQGTFTNEMEPLPKEMLVWKSPGTIIWLGNYENGFLIE